jgi:hypothetical protein
VLISGFLPVLTVAAYKKVEWLDDGVKRRFKLMRHRDFCDFDSRLPEFKRRNGLAISRTISQR